MSLFSKAKKLLNKGAKYLPGLAQLAPNSKGLATAAATLQTVSGVLGGAGGGLGSGVLSVGGYAGGTISVPKPAILTAPKGVSDMSISTAGLPAFPGGSGGFVKTGMPGLSAMVGASKALMPAVRTGTTAVVAAGRKLLPKVNKATARALGWVTVGALVYDAAGNLMGSAPSRRMNPLNPRAARRAIRRIKGARKMLQRLESQLPKRKCAHAHAHRHR